MELLFESRRNLAQFSGRLRFEQYRPTVHPEPVIMPDTFVDGRGAVLYGTVLNEGGRLRMWYQAVPRDWDHAHDVAGVAYAESDDGYHWTKPELGLVECGPGKNHLTSLSLHAPAIFVDPAAPAERRYRATGCVKPGHAFVAKGQKPGIYLAHSSDGFDWTHESEPRWPYTGDVSSSVYHPGRGEAAVAVKFMARRNGIVRRSISMAAIRDEVFSEAIPAMVPDEFDDIAAMQRGGVSADYYGMGMLPAGKQGMVGFLWHYWHMLPFSPGPGNLGPVGLYGNADITLVYQEQAHSQWQHAPGRPGFIERRDVPWRTEWVYSSSSPVEVGDEHRLYFTTFPFSHGRQLGHDWTPDPEIVAELENTGYGRIAMASWPKWRLFGLFADPHGQVTIKLGRLEQPHRVKLNYRGGANGRVRATVIDDNQRTLENAVTLTGDQLAGAVAWRGSDLILPGDDVCLKLDIHDATVYAYQLELA